MLAFKINNIIMDIFNLSPINLGTTEVNNNGTVTNVTESTPNPFCEWNSSVSAETTNNRESLG